MRTGASCCLVVSRATESAGWRSPSEKMKLKSLLLRYYPPGKGGPPSNPWGPRIRHREGLEVRRRGGGGGGARERGPQ